MFRSSVSAEVKSVYFNKDLTPAAAYAAYLERNDKRNKKASRSTVPQARSADKPITQYTNPQPVNSYSSLPVCNEPKVLERPATNYDMDTTGDNVTTGSICTNELPKVQCRSDLPMHQTGSFVRYLERGDTPSQFNL